MAAQQGQQGDDKDSMSILWIVAGIFILGGIIWWSFSEQLKYAFVKIKLIEAEALYWAIKYLPFPTLTENIASVLTYAKTVTPNNISMNIAEVLSVMLGRYYSFPAAAVLGVFATIMYKKNVRMRYKKRYNMELLATQESIEWPQINPVLGIDLVSQDLDQGPWAMAETPIIFCKKNRLITIGAEIPSVGALSKGPKFVMKLNEARADQIFVQQLGRVWRGPEHLPKHRLAIFAAIIARAARDTNASRDFILQINCSATNDVSKELNFAGVDELWQKHYNKKAIQEVIQAHAYEFTVFYDLFLLARQDGVFATADFLWLKPRDRSFWYVLNSVGRQTPYCEAAGIYAHFLAEKSLGRALNVPMVAEAKKALKSALDDIIYKPTPEEKEDLLKSLKTQEA